MHAAIQHLIIGATGKTGSRVMQGLTSLGTILRALAAMVSYISIGKILRLGRPHSMVLTRYT